QPSAVGGAYYVPNAVTPVYTYNDNGGVHQNSGIINKAAYSIAEAGMSLEDMFSLFYTGLQILTPANSFADVHAALVFACRAGGMEEYEEVINQVFRSSNVLDAGYTRRELETEVIPQGCGRVSFAVPEHSDPRAVYVAVFYDGATGKHMVETWPDCDGEVCMALPEGDYYVDIVTVDLRNGKLYGCTYSDEGWVSLNEYNGDTFYVREGRITRLPDADKSGITAVTAAAETDRSGSSAMPAMPGGERAKTPAASPRSYTRRTFSENMGLDDDGNPIILEVLDAMVPEGWTEDFSVDWHSLSIEHPAEVRLLLTDPEGEVSFGYVSARSFHQEESYATQGKITGLIISHEDGEESESQRKTYLAYRTVGNYLMWLYGQQGMTVEIVEDRPADEELFGRFADYVTGNFGEMTALYDLFSQGTISSYEALAYDGSMVDIRLRLTDGDGTSYVDVIGAGDGYEHVAHLTGMDTYDVFWNIYGLYLMEADSEAKLDRYRDTYLDIIANLHEKSEFRRLSTALGLMLAQQSVVNNSLLLDDVYEYVVGHAPDNPTDPDAVIQSPEDIFSSGDEGMHWDEVTAGRTDYAAADGVVFTTGSDASAVYQRDDGFFVAGRRTEDAPEGEGWTKLEGK
ncbi:MAG: M4 family metallopeptidase, partial [Lachnospiraceae bacterium]|nr:M4 family metallopeptidase [Lachnospiraceae bacterium]